MGNPSLRLRSLDGPVTYGIQADELPALNGHVEWVFAEMARVTRGADTTEALKRCVETGERQLWLVVQNRQIVGGALTRVLEGDKRVVEIVNASGRNWLEWGGNLFDTIEEWARSIGAEWVTASVRMGLADFLKNRGMKQRRVELEKRL